MYYCDVDATVESVQNCPTTHAFSLFVEIGAASEVVQTLKTWHDGNRYKTTVYVRSKYPEWAAGWQKLATATPPQEFGLPLAAGWNNYGVAVSRYSKNQFGEVSVIIDITNTGSIASGSTVVTFPAGFRPANPFDAPAIISNDPKGVGKCYFRPNGEIAIAGIGTASWDRVDYFTAQASFVASS